MTFGDLSIYFLKQLHVFLSVNALERTSDLSLLFNCLEYSNVSDFRCGGG